MYQYKSERLALKGFITQELKDHNKIINRYVKEGWRLVQVLPVKYDLHGLPLEVEIIFEREIDN